LQLQISRALGYASQYILSQFPSPEIGRVVTGRASGIKMPWGATGASLGLFLFSSVWLLQAYSVVIQ